MKKDVKKTKGKIGRPRKEAKSIAEFVGDIEKDRLAEQEHELFYTHIDHAEIEKYVKNKVSGPAEDEVDNFSYWFGQS